MRRIFFAIALLAAPLYAQLTFEVASVKPSPAGGRGSSLNFQPGGGLKTTNVPLMMLLTFAYDVRNFQISGAPSWASSETYDILARPERTSEMDSGALDPRKFTDEQFKTMGEQIRERTRALLADRFQLKIHRETKEGSVYALVVAKGGPKLEVAEENREGNRGMRMNRGQLNGMQAPMEMLANILSNLLGKPVLDQTGLKAKYNFKLEWTPDPSQGGGFGPKAAGGEEPTTPPEEATGPTVFTALQEQLGLRLESTKGPIPMVVIDHVEKPTEN